jgi:AraC-like DNA-binding protein
LSVRQLQRRFLNATGLTPKQFARVQRWRATAIKLAGDAESKLVDCAAELGFTDQAHLSREVRDFDRSLAEIFHRKSSTNRTRQSRLKN